MNLLEISHVTDVTPSGKLLKISNNNPNRKIGRYFTSSSLMTIKKNINIEAMFGNIAIGEKNLIGTAENAEKKITKMYSKKFLAIRKNLLFLLLNIITILDFSTKQQLNIHSIY